MSDSTKEKEKALNGFVEDIDFMESDVAQNMPHQPVTAEKVEKETKEKRKREKKRSG